MGAKAFDDLVFVSLFNLFLNFFQSEVHHVVMVQLFAGEILAKAQPQTMEEIYFVSGEVRRVRAENFVDFVAVR